MTFEGLEPASAPVRRSSNVTIRALDEGGRTGVLVLVGVRVAVGFTTGWLTGVWVAVAVGAPGTGVRVAVADAIDDTGVRVTVADPTAGTGVRVAVADGIDGIGGIVGISMPIGQVFCGWPRQKDGAAVGGMIAPPMLCGFTAILSQCQRVSGWPGPPLSQLVKYTRALFKNASGMRLSRPSGLDANSPSICIAG